MPNTRPGIKFDDEGVCYPCRAAERMKKTDWKQRWNELEQLADKYRGSNGDYYDCINTASAGKDSYYQTYILKEKLGLNPLLVSIDNISWTETGRQNWANLLEEFSVDAHVMSINRKVMRKTYRKAFEKIGNGSWYFDRAIYAYPIKLAIQLDIPLIFYGEDTNYLYGGPFYEEKPSALDQINNGVAEQVDWNLWLDDEITMMDLNPAVYPTLEEIKKAKLNPTFLSYFVPWSDYGNMEIACEHGFKTLDDTGEWDRDGRFENYGQIDTIGYIVDCWLKFPKFCHQKVSEGASLWIREGRITREEGVEKVNEEDWMLDRKALADYLDFLQITEDYFWKKVDKWVNKDLLEKRDGNWRLKEPCH